MFRAHRTHHPERQIVSIQHLVAVTLCRWPCRLQVGSEGPYAVCKSWIPFGNQIEFLSFLHILPVNALPRGNFENNIYVIHHRLHVQLQHFTSS